MKIKLVVSYQMNYKLNIFLKTKTLLILFLKILKDKKKYVNLINNKMCNACYVLMNKMFYKKNVMQEITNVLIIYVAIVINKQLIIIKK